MFNKSKHQIFIWQFNLSNYVVIEERKIKLNLIIRLLDLASLDEDTIVYE